MLLLTVLKEIMTNMTPWRIDDINQLAEDIHRMNSLKNLIFKGQSRNHKSTKTLNFLKIIFPPQLIENTQFRDVRDQDSGGWGFLPENIFCVFVIGFRVFCS